jgi:hypothetical protein
LEVIHFGGVLPMVDILNTSNKNILIFLDSFFHATLVFRYSAVKHFMHRPYGKFIMGHRVDVLFVLVPVKAHKTYIKTSGSLKPLSLAESRKPTVSVAVNGIQ